MHACISKTNLLCKKDLDQKFHRHEFVTAMSTLSHIGTLI